MTALEMQFAAVRAMRTTELPRESGHGATAAAIHVASRSICGDLGAADAYAWSSDIVSAVWLASRTVPLSSRLELHDLPSSRGWWWFDTPPGGGDMKALAWLIQPDAIDVLVFVLEDRAAPRLWAHFFWKPGTSVDDFLSLAQGERPDLDWNSVQTGLVLDTGRLLLAGLAWLQQRILCMSSGHIERHRRKQMAREYDAPMPSDVKVIQLRRTESQSRPPSEGGEAVDWSCRWIVNGHWRNQPYKDERKLIYIMPFVKGPDDKPLKVPTHTVYQVSR
jgi:hypothetical protein